MKTMNKLLSVFLVLVLMLSIIPVSAVPASAASVPVFSLAPSKITAQVGDIISVDVNVTEKSRLCALVFDIVYDESAFEVVGVTAKQAFSAEMINAEYSSRAVRFVGTTTSYISDEATNILTVKFKVTDNCGDIYILLKEAYVINAKNENVNVTMDSNFLSETITIHESGIEKITLAPTCENTGCKTYTCPCGEVIEEVIPATGHNDSDSDGYCNICDELICDHSCHQSGIAGFFWKITLFFSKLFGSNKYCECGALHY